MTVSGEGMNIDDFCEHHPVLRRVRRMFWLSWFGHLGA